MDDHHIEPESAGADDLVAPEALPQGLGAEVEKIEQVKAGECNLQPGPTALSEECTTSDEEAETPGANEVTENYTPTEEDKAVVMDRLEEASPPPATEVPTATPEAEETAAPAGARGELV